MVPHGRRWAKLLQVRQTPTTSTTPTSSSSPVRRDEFSVRSEIIPRIRRVARIRTFESQSRTRTTKAKPGSTSALPLKIQGRSMGAGNPFYASPRTDPCRYTIHMRTQRPTKTRSNVFQRMVGRPGPHQRPFRVPVSSHETV